MSSEAPDAETATQRTGSRASRSQKRPAGRVLVTERDRQVLRTVWQLGYATRRQLRALHAPATDLATVTRRLRILREHGLLTRLPVHAGGGDTMAPLTLGPRAGLVAPVYRRPWRPSRWQMAHTLAVGDVLVALLSGPYLAEWRVLSWHGEAELRGWVQGSDPIPDLLLNVEHQAEGRRVALHVEVDLATEARGHWRKKLQRYLYLRDVEILVVTTSGERAGNLRRLGEQEGVALRAVTFDDLGVDSHRPGRPEPVGASHRDLTEPHRHLIGISPRT